MKRIKYQRWDDFSWMIQRLLASINIDKTRITQFRLSQSYSKMKEYARNTKIKKI